jgi:hypothetical protein
MTGVAVTVAVIGCAVLEVAVGDRRMTWGDAGAPGGIRTPNLLIRSQMLYPLSHGCLLHPWAQRRSSLADGPSARPIDSPFEVRTAQPTTANRSRLALASNPA